MSNELMHYPASKRGSFRSAGWLYSIMRVTQSSAFSKCGSSLQLRPKTSCEITLFTMRTIVPDGSNGSPRARAPSSSTRWLASDWMATSKYVLPMPKSRSLCSTNRRFWRHRSPSEVAIPLMKEENRLIKMKILIFCF